MSRLRRTAEIILDYDLVRYDIGIRQWALSNEKTAKAVAFVNEKRMDFVGGALQEIGFTGEDLEMRTLLFACYHSCESIMFRDIPTERRRKLIQRRIELITSR